ncbi:LuxS/MPP-like metallohydrolase [Lojkania enalia]|uniref:LuxS/MPP-like metallohydrolase n=1 Tax=Lojkania enalia TaxID=147567 RepID=A0A9P4NA25_9PLEO|nr:LuxS/MPP-like metallohydrolase [Didymosphaeria enalia]
MGEPLGREARQRIEDIERPVLDDRSYRITTLPNQLEVLLIHDPKTDKASAALDVNVGSFSDAEDMPGIAHAVEHLLFMGTEKYPKENAYNQYLTSHSGHSNAYTAATSTNFYFELAASSSKSAKSSPDSTQENLSISKEDSPLWGALDRFGQFFICPLFLEDTVDREIKAVDSENKKNLQADQWRLHQLGKSLANPNHPYCHFSTGSWKTLHDDPISRGVKIRDEFMRFHDKHYSANRMKLVVLGKEDLDTLEQWVDEIFSQVPNKDLPRKRWDDMAILTEKELLIQTFAKPVMEMRNLMLSFSYRDEEAFYESHPSRYLSHLIGHEGPGSIFAYVKEMGWATGLGAGGSSVCPGSGLFTISIKLTEEGLKHYKEITKIIFQYIAMVVEQPPHQWIADELIRMSDVEFRFKSKVAPSRTTSGLASAMQKPYDRKMLLSGPSVIRIFDEKAIREAMTYLRPDNFKLDIVSQDFPGGWDRKEKWYGTEYKTEKIPEDFLAEIRQAFESKERPAGLHFPHKNEFIPNRLEVEKKEVDEPLKAPKLIRNDENVRTWYKKDDQFWTPKASLFVNFRTPLPTLTARTQVIAGLYRDLVNDALVEYSYDADISGLVYEFSCPGTGLSMCVSGYNEKLHVLAEKVLLQIRDLEVREDRFKVCKDRMLRGYRNSYFTQPFHQVGSYSKWLRIERIWNFEEQLKEIEAVTAQDVANFFPLFLGQCHIEVLAHGNLYKEEALQITDMIERTIKPKKLPPSQCGGRRSLILPPGSNVVYEKQLKDPANVNHCIEYGLYIGDSQDRALRAKVLLWAQITDEPAFNQLRTIEQLGYVVFSGVSLLETWIGYRILIQSEKDCHYLEGRIEHFLSSFNKRLEDMSEEDFEGHKRAIINKRLEKLKNLTQEGNRFWNHIFSDNYDFLMSQEDAAHIEPLTKSDIKSFFSHYICPTSPARAKISVHLIAQAKPKPPTAQEQKTKCITMLATILKAENIKPDMQKLQTRIQDISNEEQNIGEQIAEKILLHLNEDLKLEKEQVEKVNDEARAALGVAETPDALVNGDGKAVHGIGNGTTPVVIRDEDVGGWKAGLQVSKAMRPVKDLEEFLEAGAKL